LFNRGPQPVRLGGWKFVAGIDFTFAPDRVLPANGYLVVARNAARLQTNYPNLTPANTAVIIVGDVDPEKTFRIVEEPTAGGTGSSRRRPSHRPAAWPRWLRRGGERVE
jgi:hypothetical protein